MNEKWKHPLILFVGEKKRKEERRDKGNGKPFNFNSVLSLHFTTVFMPSSL